MEINQPNQIQPDDIQNDQGNVVRINAEAFGAKFKGKREVWRFVSGECECYLPDYELVTIWHLRDLASGKRTRINCDKVKHITIPQFEGLNQEDMVNFARKYPKAMRALPELQREIEKLPRPYVANVIYT